MFNYDSSNFKIVLLVEYGWTVQVSTRPSSWSSATKRSGVLVCTLPTRKSWYEKWKRCWHLWYRPVVLQRVFMGFPCVKPNWRGRKTHGSSEPWGFGCLGLWAPLDLSHGQMPAKSEKHTAFEGPPLIDTYCLWWILCGNLWYLFRRPCRRPPWQFGPWLRRLGISGTFLSWWCVLAGPVCSYCGRTWKGRCPSNGGFENKGCSSQHRKCDQISQNDTKASVQCNWQLTIFMMSAVSCEGFRSPSFEGWACGCVSTGTSCLLQASEWLKRITAKVIHKREPTCKVTTVIGWRVLEYATAMSQECRIVS